MLHVPTGSNTFGLTTPSTTSRPAAAMGTSITPAVGSFGSWAQVGSDLTHDSYAMMIQFNSNYTSAAARQTCANIGVDEAGGSSYTSRIDDLLCGGADSYTSGGRSGSGVYFYFPLFIPAGSSIACQSQSTVTTAHRCYITTFNNPAAPELIRKGSFVETLGIGTRPDATLLTPGSTSEGSWVSIGTTTKRVWWWQLGFQGASGDTSSVQAAVHCDISTDSGGSDIIIKDMMILTSSIESKTNQPLTAGVEWDTPAGTTMYVRAQSSGTAEANQQIALYGLGG